MIETLLKYKDSEIEVSRMGLKKETVPAGIGGLGLPKTGIGKYVEKIPTNINTEELPKISLLGTAHILQNVLSTNYMKTPPKPLPRKLGASRSPGQYEL